MLRYMGLYWNRTNDTAQAAADTIASQLQARVPAWSQILATQGLHILHLRDDTSAAAGTSISDERGVVFGTLFRSAKNPNVDATRVMAFSAQERERIVEAAGQTLMDSYWGRYVAFVFDPRHHRLQVFRDPSEGMPCYWMYYNGVTVIFSDLRDAVRVGAVPRSVNWSYIRAHLRWNRLHTHETGFEGVSALRGGECLTCCEGGEMRSFYWTPHQFCRSTEFEDIASAARGLRSAVHQCAKTWASTYDTMVELLSGGLDSAILLSGLRRGCDASGVVCVNLVTPGAQGDERDYASKAAAFWGCELVEQHLDPAEVKLADSVDIPVIPIPSYHLFSYRMDEAMTHAARYCGAQALMSGRAGDQLFFKSRTSLTVADHIRRHWGFGHLIQIAKDRAIVTGSTITALVADAWKYGVRRQQYDPYSTQFQYAPFLDNDTLGLINDDDFRHPWLTGCYNVPPGKLDHIYTVIDSLIYNYDPLGSALHFDVVNTLISQPIIERCLEIPSYILASGRRDRGLARLAFSEDVPQEILTRRTKGGTSRYFSEVIEHNREFLCEFVLDGELARQKLIVPELLEPLLTGAEPFPIDYCFPFMSCISVEAWLRSFDNAGTWAAA